MRKTGLTFGILSILLAIVALGVQVADVALRWFTDASPLTSTQTLVIALGASATGFIFGVCAVVVTRHRWAATGVIGALMNLVLLVVYGTLLRVQ